MRPLARFRVLPEAEYLHLLGMLLQVRFFLDNAEARHGRRRVALLGSALWENFELQMTGVRCTSVGESAEQKMIRLTGMSVSGWTRALI